MDDEGGEALEPPPGDGPFAVKVDRGIERLGKDIAEAQSFEAMGEVLEKAQVSAPTPHLEDTRGPRPPRYPAPHPLPPPSSRRRSTGSWSPSPTCGRRCSRRRRR